MPTLLEGRRTRVGRNVSEFKNRTPRLFRPNIVFQNLYSELLDRRIKFRIAAGAIRSIDKRGGLDAFMLTKPDVEFECEHALKIKKEMEKAYNAANRAMQKVQAKEAVKNSTS